MAKHPFLSAEWIVEARKIREEYRGRAGAVPAAVRMNLVITDVPFDEASVDAHLDTTSGEMEIDTGHLESAELTVTLDYPTARGIFVEQDSSAAMQAFMGGRIKVQGDLAKLIALQSQAPDAAALEVATRVKDITE